MSDFREQLHDVLSGHLNRIARLFVPGVKLTLVIRTPDVPGDTGIVIGNDDYDAAIAEIQQQRQTGIVTGCEPPRIDQLIERSSIGAGLANIREKGIEAELRELESKPRKRMKRS
jgi:hypothetical protein